ncbi:MAG: dihydrofolate reductase [Syntrophomonas sp.]|nr:dihydrofolate reductase [Syntrophomonas sp.]
MKALVAVDLNWGIGYKGNLLLKIPEDMKFFKQTTLGKAVVMGRATFESLPGQRPLKDRNNFVLSTKGLMRPDVMVCPSLKDLFIELGKYPLENIFVIGGEKAYKDLLPYCQEAYVTKIESIFEADRYCVNLDEHKSWEPIYTGEERIYNDITFRFLKYRNKDFIDFRSSLNR